MSWHFSTARNHDDLHYLALKAKTYLAPTTDVLGLSNIVADFFCKPFGDMGALGEGGDRTPSDSRTDGTLWFLFLTSCFEGL